MSKTSALEKDLTYDKIDTLTNVEGHKWAAHFGFEKCYSTFVELKEKLKLEVTKNRRKSTNNPCLDNQHTNLSNLAHEEATRRTRLKRYSDELQSILERFNGLFKEIKNPLVNEIIEETKAFKVEKARMLQDFLPVKPNPIFITGEVSAGKSSFVNLILKDNVMPTHFDKKTATFCVISYGEEKEAKIHLKNGMIETLQESPHEPFNERCGGYLDGTRKDVEYVELKCNNEILKSGIEIMDSPGMGDRSSQHCLEEKLKDACAFVFIVEFSDPIPPDTQYLARIVMKSSKVPGDLIFIINKWDKVTKEKDKDWKRNEAISRIKHFMAESCIEPQIIFMSVKAATYMQNNDVMADDYKEFLDHIHLLKMSTMANKTTKFYGLMVGCIQSIFEKLVFLKDAIKTDRGKRMEEADKLDEICEQISVSINERYGSQRKELESKTMFISRQLLRALKKDGYQQQFLEEIEKGVQEEKAPKRILEDKKFMNQLVVEFAAERLSRLLRDIDMKDNLMHNIIKDYMQGVFEEFSEIEERIKSEKIRLFSQLNSSHRNIAKIQHHGIFSKALIKVTDLSIRSKVVFGVMLPITLPFIFAIGVMAVNFEMVKTLMERYDTYLHPLERKKYIMEKATNFYKIYTSSDKYIYQYVEENIKVVEKTLEEIYIASMKELQKLQNKAVCLREITGDEKDILRIAKEMKGELKPFTSDLQKYGFGCLQYDNCIPESVLAYNSVSDLIGRSTNSEIYRVTVYKDDANNGSFVYFEKGKQFSLKKIFWNPLLDSEQTIQDDLHVNIKKSNHSSILRAFNIVKSPVDADEMNVFLLSEPIEMTLRLFLRKQKLIGRGKFDYLLSIFDQVKKGLEYLHSVSVEATAYELNLDTLMVTKNGKVKLMNMNSSRYLFIPNVQGQDRVLKYRHLPPEVLLKKSTMNKTHEQEMYDNASDWYSFAVAQFEAWWGLEAYQDFIFDLQSPIDSLELFAFRLQRLRYAEQIHDSLTKVIDTDVSYQPWYQGVCDLLDSYQNQRDSLRQPSYCPNLERQFTAIHS